ncbi:MAG: phosphoadenylyl-sulfate reductase [Candidatus Thermoplasmatota archaeon]|nr:phosphoadenylyl-sulfate reductase [Candidatus Thermoplasmatota archaeon]
MSGNIISELADSSLKVIREAYESHGDSVIFLTSFGAEDMVISHLSWEAGIPLRHVTIDTGRLPGETYEIMDRVREKYGFCVEIAFPERKAVEETVLAHGINLFYKSREMRELCCRVRKVEPLNRVLSSAKAWVSGIRADQTSVRAVASEVEIDHAHGGITKYNPVLQWTSRDIWSFIAENSVPYNSLFNRGYRSIGCAPCTRPVNPGEDERSGRWWWESGTKECGLHVNERTDVILERGK